MRKFINLFTLLVFFWTNFLTPISYAQISETWEVLVWDGSEVVTENVEEVKMQTGSEYSDIEDTVEEVFEENLDEDVIADPTLDDMDEIEFLDLEENEVVESELNQQLSEEIEIDAMVSAIKTAILLPWMDFNKKLKTLANWREESYWNVDYNVLQIVESEYEAPEWADVVNLASVHSDYPIYFWYESWIVYYHTEADEVYFNEDCRYMFSRFGNLKMIDIAKFDNSNMTNIDYMFAYSENLKYIISSDFSFRNSWYVFDDDYNLIWQGWTKYKWWRGIYAYVDNETHSWYFWWDYVVMFNSNWWDEVNPQVFGVWEEYNIQEPNIERENSIFKWWYTVGWQKWNFNDTVTKPTMLYAKWKCEDWYLMSIDGNSCVSTDTIVVDSVDWGKITIMKENIWVGENWWWNERDQWPCPAWYHVPTMQEWNTLFVSWCENHTILWDGICDIRDIDRQTWEYGKDFIYFTKNEESIRKFWEEMNLEVKLNFSELNEIYNTCKDTRYNKCWWWWCYNSEEWEEYGCEDLLNGWYVGGVLWAYRTSTPEWNILWFRKSYFRVNSFYPNETSDPLFRSTLDSEKTPVRCFADDYTAPDKLVMFDIIEKENLAEYKEFEQKIRSWEIELPDEKIDEILLLTLMDETPKHLISILLEEIDNVIENIDSDEEIQYFQELKSLLEDVKDATDENKSEISDRVNSFDWMRLFENYDVGPWIIFAVDNALWVKNFSEIVGINELMTEVIEGIERDVDDIFSIYDFFTDFDKELIYSDIENLRYCESKDDFIVFFENLDRDLEDLLDNYADEIWAQASIYKMTFSFVLNLVETSLSVLELDEFVEEVKDYLWTQDWIREDGTLDYQEMVTQEYLYEEFAKMWYRVMLTSEMSANDIREKIANIKWITLENDEYLALFDVDQEEINIDGWINHYERWYVEPKKIRREWQSGGWWHWWDDWWNKLDPKNEDDDHWSADDEKKTEDPEKDLEPMDELIQKPLDNLPKDWKTFKPLPQELDMEKYDDTYSEEFNRAYQFSYSNNITTKWSIKEAQMYWNLTRIQMAKMLSQYAINVLWKQPNKTENNQFNDVSDEQNEKYDNAVTLAYQLWIMWQNMLNNNFRPNDEVTRAEFVTAFSRMLYNTLDGEYKSTSKYYIHHMEKLKEEWIITRFEPKMNEKRWYVMIMLMRSVE